jgi:hypothetical protein
LEYRVKPEINPKKKVDNNTLAYIAGLFDAEVSFHIHKTGINYYFTLDWLKIDRDILQYVSDIFGGTITSLKARARQRYQVWHWYLGSSDAYAALKRIYPFLRIKQKPASICIEFCRRYPIAVTVIDMQSIGAEYQVQLQQYQRKPGGSKKSAEALKLIREIAKSVTKESESTGIMHAVFPDLTLPEVETSYIAGLLDADASFLINKIHERPSYLLEVKYRKYDRPMLEYLATIFGGRVRRAPISSNNQLQPWLWQVTSQKAYKLIKHIYPYLRIKKRNAEICIEFFEKYWTGNYGVSISPERQRIGERYNALLKPYLTKSISHKKTKENLVPITWRMPKADDDTSSHVEVTK